MATATQLNNGMWFVHWTCSFPGICYVSTFMPSARCYIKMQFHRNLFPRSSWKFSRPASQQHLIVFPPTRKCQSKRFELITVPSFHQVPLQVPPQVHGKSTSGPTRKGRQENGEFDARVWSSQQQPVAVVGIGRQAMQSNVGATAQWWSIRLQIERSPFQSGVPLILILIFNF